MCIVMVEENEFVWDVISGVKYDTGCKFDTNKQKIIMDMVIWMEILNV